jgi:uncharacterized protein YgiM (DUF1202 family)
MKKSLLIIIIITLLMMTGCGDKGEFASFIPTPIPESENSGDDAAAEDATEDTADNGSETSVEGTPTPKPLHVGQTTTMYVKLDKYDAILNVRATASKDGDIVGFLVHTEKIKVIDIVDGWASFAQGGEVRYVSSDFLVKERPDYIEPPKPSSVPTKKPTPTNKPAQENTPVQDSEPEVDTDEAPPEI